MTLLLPPLLLLLACDRSPAEPPAEPPAPAVAAPTAAAPADPPPPAASATLCPAGTHAVDWWPGEYPGPVVQVLREVTVDARADSCDPTPGLACTLKPGLYHPWARMGPGAAPGEQRFRSIDAVARYAVLQTLTVEGEDGDVQLAPGDTLTVLAYLAEGMCAMQAGEQPVSGTCPGVADDAAVLRELPGAAKGFARLQFLGVDCGEGHAAWVLVDDSLLARPELTEGRVTGYGEIGPAAP